ncbi:SET domain-containing protein-lysine N-methyltransferase [Streptomyces sp. NPDC049881]|uniref:SET domain-containing protein n=1 Tax=Streptomyces sp. NPDC049881 TaxID=3155778 RepID=UPI00342D1ED5
MLAHPPPTESLLDPRAVVLPSPIEGFGLFAAVPIPPGQAVQRFGGRLLDDAALAALTPPHSSLAVAEGLHLLLDPETPARFGNHSCDPNLWFRDALTTVTRRAVAAGEELTVDYATLTGVEDWSMDCRCGSPLCRGAVTGRDWRRAGLRAAYGRHWTPPLLARIDALGETAPDGTASDDTA